MSVALLGFVLLGVAVRGTVGLMLARDEARATRRYVRVLEKRNTKTHNTMQVMKGEWDALRNRGNMAHLALRIGTLAARQGNPMSDREALEMARTILEASTRHGVPARTIIGVIMTESGFDRRAVSPKGAVGLMQLMPATARLLARELDMELDLPADLRDPAVNIELGTFYLGKLLRSHGTEPEALTAYNMGPGHGGSIARAFVATVTRYTPTDL